MTLSTRSAATAAALALTLALGGCVSLFPKSNPAQLYRFQVAPAEAPSVGARTSVALAPLEFNPAASGDRILTSDGSELAYIGDSRWISPAVDLFGDALEGAFSGAAKVRLIERRQATGSTPVLSVKVDTFEARYLSGPKAAPTVTVGITARLMRYPDRAILGERRFEATQAAGDNRVAAIVQAYDGATGQALKDLVAWTDATAPAMGAPQR